jgi:hypothetical protein
VAFALGVAALTAGAFALLPDASTFVAKLLCVAMFLATGPVWRLHARHVHEGAAPPLLRSNGAKVCSADIYRMFVAWVTSGSAGRQKAAELPRIVERQAARVLVVGPTFSRQARF